MLTGQVGTPDSWCSIDGGGRGGEGRGGEGEARDLGWSGLSTTTITHPHYTLLNVMQHGLRNMYCIDDYVLQCVLPYAVAKRSPACSLQATLQRPRYPKTQGTLQKGIPKAVGLPDSRPKNFKTPKTKTKDQNYNNRVVRIKCRQM